MTKGAERARMKRVVRAAIRDAVKPFGYVSDQNSFIRTRNGITLGIQVWFVPIRESADVFEVSIEVFAWSEEAAKIMDKYDAEMRWKVPLVLASLTYLAIGQRGHWDIHLDEPGSEVPKIADITKHLVETGLPFLDKIQTNHDIVRMMRDTVFTPFVPDLRKKLVAKYAARFPDFT